MSRLGLGLGLGFLNSSGGALALLPTFGINGSSLAPFVEFGTSPNDILTAHISDVDGEPRLPDLYISPTTKTWIGSWSSIRFVDGADNTGSYIYVSRSTDNGKTWSAAILAMTTTTIGTTSINESHVVELGGVLYMVAYETTFANNTATPWKDFAGNNPAKAFAQKIFVSSSSDDGLTWSAKTDITSQIFGKVTHKKDQYSSGQFGANVSNADGTHGGLGSYRVTIPAGESTRFGVGNYISVRFSGVTGTDATTLNYATNGNVAFDCIIHSDTTLDIIDAAAPGFHASTVFTSAVGLPQAGWIVTAGQGDVGKDSGGTTIAVIPMTSRTTYSAQGTAFCFTIKSSDGITWTPSTQDTSLLTTKEIEGSVVYLGTPGNWYMNCRPSGTAYRSSKGSTDGASTWGTQTIHDGSNGGLILNGNATLAGLCRVGNQTILICPSMVNHRRSLTAYISGTVAADGSGSFSTQKRLTFGQGGYSVARAASDGTIACIYEYDYADQFLSSIAIGRLGLCRTNLAGLKTTTPDEIRLTFNQQANGVAAWAPSANIIDVGGLGAHAVIQGKPVYKTVSGLTGLSLASANSDYVVVTPTNGSEWYPDSDAQDVSSGWTMAFEFDTAGTPTGVIFGGVSTVGTHGGAGTVGISLVINGSGKPVLTIDDGTNTCVLTSLRTVNDGGKYRVICQRTAGPTHYGLTLTVYNMSGTNLDQQSTFNDTCAFTQGALTNTVQQCLARYGDTATGRMSGTITFYLARCTRSDVLPLPIPYVAPTPDGPTPDSNVGAPENLGTQLKLHVFNHDPYLNRGPNGMGRPAILRHGDGITTLYDKAQGFASITLVKQAYKYGIDPTYGGYHSSGTLVGGQSSTFQNTAGKFDFIHQFSGPWSIELKFKVLIDDGGDKRIAWYLDGTRGFFLYGNSQRLRFTTAGAHVCSIQMGPTYSVGADVYALNTWYKLFLDFNGTNGSGVTGLTAWVIPLSPTLTDVTPYAHAPQDIGSSTLGDSSSCTTNLLIFNDVVDGGSGSPPLGWNLSDLVIRQENLSNADKLKSCLYLVA